MKRITVITSVLIITLLVVSVTGTILPAEESELEVAVTGINDFYRTQENQGSVFTFETSIEVNNPTDSTLNYTHSDTCLFKVVISYQEHTDWESYYPFACGEALVIETYDPGITNTNNAMGAIKFSNTSLTALPDGEYIISLQQEPWQDQVTAEDLHFIASDGEIDIYNPEERGFVLSFSTFLTTGAIIVVLSAAKRKVRKSIK